MRRRLLPLLAVLALGAACANPERDKLTRGMQYARRHFADVQRNPIAAMALGSTLEGGGTLTTYLTASMPENADLPAFRDERPVGPWSVALRAFGTDSVIIEGFGEKTDHPILAETVSVRLVRRPSM